MMEEMSEIEKQIVAKTEKQIAQKKKEDKKKDKSWWTYNDPNIYFTVSTQTRYSFEAGDQIFTSYGRRSNKFLLIFYGFCIPDNKHDSILMRINKKLSDEDRFSIDSIVQALVVPNDKIEQGFLKDSELNKLETTDKT